MKRWLLLAALALAGAPHAARAAGCSVNATAVAFGTVSLLSAASSTGTVSVSCNGFYKWFPFSYTVALSSGFSGSFTARTMLNGSYKLTYNLYTDSAHTQIWGDGNGGSVTESGYTSNPASYTVYGLLPAQTAAAPGAYSDTITVTVSY